MRLQDHIDFTTLQWVKPELDDTLSIAREALESYVDNPGKRDYMRTCVDHLHQVQGTLQMVELYGAAMVTAEMEALALALLGEKVTYREEAYAALMRGLMQLPDYLERLSSGHRDVPVVLLPLLNDLRASRELEPLPESAMFHPNLDAFLPEQAPAAMSETYADAHRGELAELRLRFQQQLLGWFRGQNAAQQLVNMRKTLLAITARCHQVHGRRLWWIAAGVLEGLEQGVLKGQAGEIRQLIGKVDRNIRLLIEQGEASLRGGDADDVARKLLYIVAQAKQRSPQMEQLRDTYALDTLLPDAGELEHARGSMAGHNRALLDSVSRALKDDLLRVKEALDLFLRQQNGDPAQLAAQGEVLERVGDTLGMLALSVPRRVVAEQRRVLDEIANRMRQADEETLLDVAGALLYVEASLDDHIESLGSEDEADTSQVMPSLPRSEALGVVTTLMQEAIANTGKVKDAIVAFVESGWEHGRLAGAPALMDEVAGAMHMLSSPRPAELARGVGRFIGNELLDDRRVPSGVQMDQLADALAALEYYLEAAREHRGGLEHILDVAEHSLSLLGYWPLPSARAASAAPLASEAASVESAAADEEHLELTESVSLLPGEDLRQLFVGDSQPLAAAVHDLDGLRLAQTETAAPVGADRAAADEAGEDWIEIEEEVVERVPVRDALADNTNFNVNAEGIDDDIREIFLEEMQEEIDNLRSAEQLWLADPAQNAALVGIRRSFHTLKGSGRLVGAGVLGEFAWKVEDMLNRVLDGTIQPDENVQALVRHAIDALPQLLAALKDEGMPRAPLGAIMHTAEQLAAGNPARVEDHAPRAMETVRRIVRRRVPRLATAAEAIPAAGLAGVGAAPEPVEPEHAVEMPVMPPVDPVLLEILRSEVAQYLQTIRAAIQRSGDELPIGEELLRAVHTLHGAIAMVDIPLLTQLLSPLEGLFKRLRAANLPLSSEGLRLLGQAVDVVDRVMGQFDAVEPQLPDADALTAQITNLRDRYPESKVAHVVFEPQAEEAESAEIAGMTDEADAYQAIIADSLEASMADAATARAGTAPADAPANAGEIPEIHLEDAQHTELTAELVAALGAFEPERADAERAAAEKLAAEQAAAAQAEAEKLAAEQAAAAQAAAEKLAAEQAAAAQAAAEKLAVEQAAAAQAAAERLAVEQAAAAQAAAEKQAAKQAAADRANEEATGTATPEPAYALAGSGHIDADLLEVFIDEAREILDHADDVLAQWHAEPAELAHVPELQRDLHTLKGGARIAGLTAVGDLSHAIETLLEEPIRDVSRTGPLIAALEASFDQLHALVQRVAQGQATDYPRAMIDHLLELAGETVLADDATAAMPAPVPVPAASSPVVSAAGEPGLPELMPEAEEEVRSPQEQIRVRADLLDNLVNHAGEVAIYRSRLEQQVAGYRFNLVELEQTVARLRSQLRMLEIETEAQIIARFQREHREAGMAAFDPLELDRYSQLQQYSRALAESVSDLVSIQSMLDELTRQAETLLIQQSRVSTELQDGLLRTRMLPFDTMVPNLRRTLRQAAQEQDKHAQLHVDGAHGEMDRNLLDRIKAPFEHMLRNAIAHGIETPAERRKAGKPVEGVVNITVAREATEVVIRVSDDGRGLNREAIRKRGIERGLLRPETRPTDNQLLSLITQTGFSTASQVTQLAGRGVGMDVVANEIKQLGGSLSIESEEGKGTTFILRLPFTLAVTQAILVRIGEATFAIPMTSVQGVARVNPDELTALMAEAEPSFQYGLEDYGIHDLAELLGLPPGLPTEDEQQPLLLTRAGDLRAAIRIDAVLGSREIVVKSVGPQISSVPGLLGATIMGDGSVLIILDLAPLVRHGMIRREQRLAEGLSAVQAPVVEEVQTKPLVMVVDDSITMRKVTSRVLERHEYEVSTAKDGVDALEKLHERVPDLMLLDIEMPRMDGYELATHMKADPRLRDVPIIMITSRSGDKHRQRAFDIGVDRYLGKPYQEAELLVQIGEVLEQRAVEPVHD
ncbi:hybrid sensor histidine kinase/response regulator [Rhodanobacter thiooxydans]|uniref:Chemotaxis protein CheA n=1 Tax=Rhodanobacter thiooxydans TaxID=416169 RepID=A0A154QMA6_9GAMM|nr:Hpt domain-containing protein [Rhodanobacter thiooxydans]EIL99725.1 two-component system sensor histidine kinase-response regulator hybrid protein pill [Rhodanobacter thiooxydans LCS2]KZC25320.1 hybrid sensor histidine kinase/response regulator [Rhodanobacter thiooxydans]MCW0202363.1 Hpt domain-containing protein [Rhodanobacter thiooxydans]